ncbi:MAG: beta-galactosidase [Pirellulales bacterium]|nr:beta-galactosidase [Pirellulales bacterium]
MTTTFRSRLVGAICAAVCLGSFSTAIAEETIGGWAFRSHGEGWRVRTEVSPTCTGPGLALVIEFPWNQRSEAGNSAELVREVDFSGGPSQLSFGWSDDFRAATAGCHFAQVLIGGAVVWEADVAGSAAEPRVTIDLAKLEPAKDRPQGRHTIGLRVATRKLVTNFGVQVRWFDVCLLGPGRPPMRLLPDPAIQAAGPVPDDLQIACAGPTAAVWHRRAIVLQPWGKTQHAALADVAGRPERLRDQFGFNAIIVLPPEAHNAITSPAEHLSEEQFRTAIDAYRKAGYKIILYSSVMHCGHAPVWQSGQLGRDHPEWSQRGPTGEPVMDYGAPWLCPNTPALKYTVDYTERIVRHDEADAVMLDNNQFFHTAGGWTCYCEACREKFRSYVRQRFGDAAAREAFGADPPSLAIPTEQGPLWNLWLHWRNRVWAEANEAFRNRLRSVRPDVLFFCNTQYVFRTAMLASDLQYAHEDMLLSESRGHTSLEMSQKMLLGHALADGRPLWNYIGTFDERDFQRLRPADVIGPITAASLGHGARPWIVYYGFTDRPSDDPGRAEVARLVSWCGRRPELFSAPRWTTVGAVISTRSRDLFGHAVIPEHLADLLARGVPAVLLRDANLSPEKLGAMRVLTIENAASIDPKAAGAIADWVRAGGKLAAAVGAGWFDELGRLRPHSTLWEALGLKACPKGAAAVGKGEVIVDLPEAIAEQSARWTDAERFRFDPQSAIEIIPYAPEGKMFLHLVRHGPVEGPVTLTLPSSVDRFAGAALHLPEEASPRPLVLDRNGGAVRLRIPEAPLYGVVELK